MVYGQGNHAKVSPKVLWLCGSLRCRVILTQAPMPRWAGIRGLTGKQRI